MIVGHTPVLSLIKNEKERRAYAIDLKNRGEHLRIDHALGFIDIDYGCGHNALIKALTCMCLEDLAEFADRVS